MAHPRAKKFAVSSASRSRLSRSRSRRALRNAATKKGFLERLQPYFDLVETADPSMHPTALAKNQVTELVLHAGIETPSALLRRHWPQECLENVVLFLPPKQRFAVATHLRLLFVQKQCLCLLEYASILDAIRKQQYDLLTAWTQLPGASLPALAKATGEAGCPTTVSVGYFIKVAPLAVEMAGDNETILALLQKGCGKGPITDCTAYGYDLELVIDLAKTPRILEWWKTSPFEFQYTERAIDSLCDLISCLRSDTSEETALVMLDWWHHSGFALKYTELAIDEASQNGYTRVLEWWKRSGHALKYTEWAISGASVNWQTQSLDWWVQSGLLLEIDLQDFAEWIENKRVRRWWRASGLIRPEMFLNAVTDDEDDDDDDDADEGDEDDDYNAWLNEGGMAAFLRRRATVAAPLL